MANFKSKISAGVGTSAQAIVTATTTLTLIGISVANVLGTAVTVSVVLRKGASSAHLIKNAPISGGDTLLLAGGEQKIVMETGDILEVVSSAATSVDVIVNYLEV